MEEGRSLSTSMQKSIRITVACKSENTLCLSIIFIWLLLAKPAFCAVLPAILPLTSFPDSQITLIFKYRLLKSSEATFQNLFARIQFLMPNTGTYTFLTYKEELSSAYLWRYVSRAGEMTHQRPPQVTAQLFSVKV